jgi:peptide/nickel transport system permease protein
VTTAAATTAAAARRGWWRPVARAVLRRALGGAAVVAAVVTLTFTLVHLAPGDPFASSLENPEVTAAVREVWRRQWGLDRPLPEQYARYVASLAHGDWGYSFSMHEPVRDALARALPNTLFLMGIAYALSFGLGVVVGALQAARRGSLLDRAIGGVALFFYSMPDFWLALMVMLTLAYWVPIFPTSGMVDPVMYAYFTPLERAADRLRHLALPALTLCLINTGAAARYQRAAMLDALKSDYVRTARAKGLPEGRVLSHALRNALLPTITLMGLAFPALLGGAVFVEKVFAWPGMGWLAVNAVNTRDYPLVLASVVVGSALMVLGSALADAGYAAADPRLRAE